MSKKDRPVIKHKHTSGVWKIRSNTPYETGGFVVYRGVSDENKTIVRLPFGNTVPVVKNEMFYENLANAKLIAIAPELLQIAEMYFDSMKNTDAENSIAFDVTLKTLNKLKNE